MTIKFKKEQRKHVGKAASKQELFKNQECQFGHPMAPIASVHTKMEKLFSNY